jgi:hypothetical protein
LSPFFDVRPNRRRPNKRRGIVLRPNQPETNMKRLTHLSAVVGLGLMTLAPAAIFAQDISTTRTTMTTTSSGTVSEWKPNSVAVKVDTSAAPIQYTFTRTTSYVDQYGNPVSVETIRSGAPVTVYYERQGDALVADKVIVRRSVTTREGVPPPIPVTTTTTTTADATPPPPATNGVVTDAGDEHIDVRTSLAPRPIHYKAHDSTAYVDENGNPVPRKILTEGTPVTVFYEQSGDDLFATRVIIRNPAVLDR